MENRSSESEENPKRLSLRERIGELIFGKEEDLVLRPINDRGGSVGLYQGPSGPIVTIAKINDNVRHGRDPGYGLPPDALSDPNAP
jgi:hypothetical protein